MGVLTCMARFSSAQALVGRQHVGAVKVEADIAVGAQLPPEGIERPPVQRTLKIGVGLGRAFAGQAGRVGHHRDLVGNRQHRAQRVTD